MSALIFMGGFGRTDATARNASDQCAVCKSQKPHSTSPKPFFPTLKRRIRAVLDRSAYKTVEEVLDAALTAAEQRVVPGFAGTPEELDALLAEGLASKSLTEDEFWTSVSKRTDALLPEHKTGRRS